MKNKPVTPYCLSLQSVLNEFSKFAIKLAEAPEYGIKHTKADSTRVNTEGLKLAQQLKSIVLAPEFNMFVRRLDKEILATQVVVSKQHGISMTQSTYKTTYEMASMALMLSNTCLMKEGEFQTGTAKRRCYGFLKDLCRKIHDICVRMLGFLNGSLANIMSHFINSMSHEIDAWGTKNGGTTT